MEQVIDVHTHMFTHRWLDLLREKGGPDLTVEPSPDSDTTVFYRGASFCVLEDAHFDFEQRIKAMDDVGVDMAIITLPAPSVFWGDEDTSLEAAQTVNDDFAQAQADNPDRIRWMASLPWEYPDKAVEELDRACDNGAIGVLTLGNINGRHLVDDLFAPVWKAIDERGLPVLLHPTVPVGAGDLNFSRYAMAASMGFMVDTSVAVAHLLFSGFFDTHTDLKLIAAHGGATLPYLAGRWDIVYDRTQRAKEKINKKPSEYLQQIYYDSVVYRQGALELCVDVGGEDNVLYGSDYPFNIGDMPGCLERVDNLPDAVRDKVRGGNAKRIFNL